MRGVLAIDLGSTQMKLMVLDEQAELVASVTEKYPTQTRADGWLEQNPKDWETALRQGIGRLKERTELDEIEVISFSGHMSGVVLLDERGNVLYPCIMLSDGRSQKQCDTLTERVGLMVKARTGNMINNAFSLPKLMWLKEEEKSLYEQAVVWLSPKDYVRYCLTGEFNTEYTDAYNSLCIDQNTLMWDDEIIAASGLDRKKFPPVYSPFDLVGCVTKEAEEKYGLKAGIPVAAGAADMACAVLGTGLSDEGDTALTLGTCATFFTIAAKGNQNCGGAVTFHPIVSGKNMYALGSHMNGGAAVNWISMLLSEKGEIDYSMIGALSGKAQSVPVGSNGVMTIPFLVGSGSPYFCPADRQHMIGMRINTTREEIFRSQLEGITYNLRQTLDLFQTLTKVHRVVLAGGGIQIPIWPEIIKDVFGIPLELSDNPDVSTIGAGLIGGTAVGIYAHPEQLAKRKRRIMDEKIPDSADHEQYKILYRKYLGYYRMLHRLDLEEQNEQKTRI